VLLFLDDQTYKLLQNILFNEYLIQKLKDKIKQILDLKILYINNNTNLQNVKQ